MTGPAPLILASTSRFRATLMTAAGLTFEAVAPGIDEAPVKQAMVAEGAPARDVADVLATLKAERVSARYPEALVIGSDQVLALGDTLYDKPRDRGEARDQLLALAGHTHQLLTAVSVARNGHTEWRTLEVARLEMRPLGRDFIESYLESMGDAVTETVGGYQLEGLGAQLFHRVKGDYFSILGLPLLPLLNFLRLRGVLAV